MKLTISCMMLQQLFNVSALMVSTGTKLFTIADRICYKWQFKCLSSNLNLLMMMVYLPHDSHKSNKVAFTSIK